MNCEEIQALIEDYHYGELGEESAERVRAHVGECRKCTSMLEQLESEDETFKHYAGAVDEGLGVPSGLWRRVFGEISGVRADAREARNISTVFARLWSSLSSRILPQASLVRLTAFAVSLMVLSVAGTLFTLHLMSPDENAAVAVNWNDAGDNSIEFAVGTIRKAEQDYMTAIETLGALVEEQKPPLDPEMRAELEKNLRIIDENIAALREAFYEHPTDHELAHYLLAAYNRKVELLEEIAS